MRGKKGVTKVPDIRYTDRNKFVFGAGMQVNRMNIICLYPFLIRSRKWKKYKFPIELTQPFELSYYFSRGIYDTI